jgi:hypothetical protein
VVIKSTQIVILYYIYIQSINYCTNGACMIMIIDYLIIIRTKNKTNNKNRFICIVFVALSPLVMLLILIYNQRKGRLIDDKHRIRYGPLYEHFKPNCYWYK